MLHKQHYPKPFIRTATEKDCLYLSKNLRKADYREIQAVCNLPPFLVLLHGLKKSQVPLVVCNENERPVFIVGVVPNGLIGNIWMFGTDELKKLSVTFLKNCKATFKILKNNFQIIHNYVDARNKLHIRWLKWMGFTFINKHKHYGVERKPFYEFIKI